MCFFEITIKPPTLKQLKTFANRSPHLSLSDLIQKGINRILGRLSLRCSLILCNCLMASRLPFACYSLLRATCFVGEASKGTGRCLSLSQCPQSQIHILFRQVSISSWKLFGCPRKELCIMFEVVPNSTDSLTTPKSHRC